MSVFRDTARTLAEQVHAHLAGQRGLSKAYRAGDELGGSPAEHHGLPLVSDHGSDGIACAAGGLTGSLRVTTHPEGTAYASVPADPKTAPSARHGEHTLAKAESVDPFAEQQAETFLSGFDFAGLATLLDDFTEVLGDVALSGARQGMTTVRLLVREPTDFALPSDVVQAWASEHAAELVGKRVLEGGAVIDNPRPEYALDDATRVMLRGTIRDAFTPDAEGAYQTFAELRTTLEGSYAFSEDRAALIARNEVGAALVQGNLAAWRASGVVTQVEWVLSDLHDVPDDCDANAGAIVALGEAFPSGDTEPPLHVNCECDLIPIVGEEE